MGDRNDTFHFHHIFLYAMDFFFAMYIYYLGKYDTFSKEKKGGREMIKSRK